MINIFAKFDNWKIYVALILIIGVLFVYVLLFLDSEYNILNLFIQHGQTINAVFALFISFLSLVIAGSTFLMQRSRNILTVKPIPSITEMNYVDSGKIGLRLENLGVGPMIIKKIESCKGKDVREDPLEWLPEGYDHILTDYTIKLENTPIAPNKYICLLYYKYEPGDKQSSQNSEVIRYKLAKLKIKVEYADVHGRKDKFRYQLQGFEENKDWAGPSRNLNVVME